MKSFYIIFVLAAIFDLIISPWFFGVGWMPKFVLSILPFAFIFLPSREAAAVFAAALIFFKVAISFNIGIVFLGLILLFYYERRFIVNFFHKTAWQSMFFSGAGIFIFYFVVLAASYFLDKSHFFFDWGVVVSCFSSMILGMIFNNLFLKIYKKDVF